MQWLLDALCSCLPLSLDVVKPWFTQLFCTERLMCWALDALSSYCSADLLHWAFDVWSPLYLWIEVLMCGAYDPWCAALLLYRFLIFWLLFVAPKDRIHDIFKSANTELSTNQIELSSLLATPWKFQKTIFLRRSIHTPFYAAFILRFERATCSTASTQVQRHTLETPAPRFIRKIWVWKFGIKINGIRTRSCTQNRENRPASWQLDEHFTRDFLENWLLTVAWLELICGALADWKLLHWAFVYCQLIY